MRKNNNRNHSKSLKNAISDIRDLSRFDRNEIRYRSVLSKNHFVKIDQNLQFSTFYIFFDLQKLKTLNHFEIHEFWVQNESNRPYTGPFYQSYCVFWHIMSYLLISYAMISCYDPKEPRSRSRNRYFKMKDVESPNLDLEIDRMTVAHSSN